MEPLPQPPATPAGRRGEHRAGLPAGPQRGDDWPIHRLLSIAARLDERWINRNLSQLGLTKSALDVLEAVAELEPAKISDLASLLCVRIQSLGGMVGRLQGLGFLVREHGNDRRTANIRLTENGRNVLRAAHELLHELPHPAPEAESTLRGQLEHHIHELRQYETHHRIP